MRTPQDTCATRPGAGADAAEPATTAASRSRIGRYAVLGLLGRGGMGDVYLGLDEQLARQVAIKVLSRGRDPARVSDRLRREALALACLAHPNVVAVHEVGEADGQLYLVMERVDGATLRSWLGERRSVDEVLAVMLQAGRGLAAAHAAGLIHRDFKPENIMIGGDGRVRVMDFGLACPTAYPETEITRTMPSGRMQLLDGATSAGDGTPGYMAPEQYCEAPQDVRCDVFSFCVVLFEALHGRRPFPGEGAQAARAATLRGELVRVRRGEAPGWLDAVIRRGLLGDPELRWPSVDALLTALQRPPPPRRRALQGLAALALTVAVGLAGAGALRRSGAGSLAGDRLVAVEAILAELGGVDSLHPVAPAERHALRRLLLLRAELRHELGEHAAALADFEAALAVPAVASDADAEARLQGHLQLVRMLAVQDPARAREHADAAAAIEARAREHADAAAAIEARPQRLRERLNAAPAPR